MLTSVFALNSCAKYLDMLVDMDTSVDLLPEEEISAVSSRAEKESDTNSRLFFLKDLLKEWNSVLLRSLSDAHHRDNSSDTDPSRLMVTASDAVDRLHEDNRSDGLESPNPRKLEVLVEAPDKSAFGSKGSNYVDKKVHLLLFSNSASRYCSYRRKTNIFSSYVS